MGYLEDYAFLADGLLTLFETSADPRWLLAGKQLLLATIEHFRDDDGSFFFTADDHEQLIARTKTVIESSTPSGMALTARALLRCGLLLADEELYETGLQTIRANHALLDKSPIACPSLVSALQFHLAEPREVVIVGAPDDPRTRALLQRLRALASPFYVSGLLHDGNRAVLEDLSPVFAGKVPVDGRPAAYVCRRGVCEAPVTDPEQLLK